MDGYVTIGTKVDNKGFDSGIADLNKRLNKSMNNMSNSMTSAFASVKKGIIALGIGALIKKVIIDQLDEAVARLDTMKNYENVMSNLGIGSEDSSASIARLSEALKGLPTTLDDAALSVQRFTAANGNVKASTEMFLAFNNAVLAGGAPLQLQAAAIEQMAQAYSRGKFEMQEWRTLLQAMPAQLKQVANVMGYTGSDAANALYEGLKSGKVSMNDFMTTLIKMNHEGLGGFKSLEEQARNSTGGIATSFQNVKTAIARGLADIMDAIGRSNIAGFFDMIRNAIDAAIPYIAAFIKLIKTAIAYVVGLFGGSLKKETNNAATSMDNLGSSASGTSKDLDQTTNSAKNLNKQLKQLAKFDEMNVLSENKNSSGGSGNTGANMGSIGDIDLSAFDNLEIKTKKVDEIFNEMMNKIKEFYNLLNSLGFDGIIKHIQSIGKSLQEIFTNPKVINAAKKWVDTVSNSLKNMTKNVIKIGINIADGFLGSIDVYLQQNSGRISEHIVTMFDISSAHFEFASKFSDALAEISEVFTSPQAEQIGADIIAMFANPIMSCRELISKFAFDIEKLLLQPIIDNTKKIKSTLEEFLKTVQPIFDTLAEAFTFVGDTLNQVYDEHISPLIEGFSTGISDTFGKILELYNQYIAPFVEQFSQDFENLWNEHLKPFVDSVGGLVGSIADYVGALWKNYVKPFIDYLLSVLIPVVAPIIAQIWETVKTMGSIIIDVITNIINILKGIIDFVVGVFTGDWDKAWNGIKGIIDSVFNTISNIIGDVMNGINNTINNGLNFIKNIFGGILTGIVNNVTTAFNTMKNVVNSVVGAIGSIISAGFSGVWNFLKGILNNIIGGFEKMINGILKGLNSLLKPLRDLGNSVLELVGIKDFKIPKITTVSIPRLAKGGIINLPSRGVPVGNAIAGERGQEGVIPLTDSQQMELLGEAIGKYIKVNANIPVYVGNRLVIREMRQIENEDDFAFNS